MLLYTVLTTSELEAMREYRDRCEYDANSEERTRLHNAVLDILKKRDIYYVDRSEAAAIARAIVTLTEANALKSW
jgi:hypothetical protein